MDKMQNKAKISALRDILVYSDDVNKKYTNQIIEILKKDYNKQLDYLPNENKVYLGEINLDFCKKAEYYTYQIYFYEKQVRYIDIIVKTPTTTKKKDNQLDYIRIPRKITNSCYHLLLSSGTEINFDYNKNLVICAASLVRCGNMLDLNKHLKYYDVSVINEYKELLSSATFKLERAKVVFNKIWNL